MSSNFAEQLEKVLKLNDKDLSNVDANQILELRKSLNPYGRIIQGSNNYLNFSITQVSQEWHKKFMTTSFIGFLFRMCNEWKVPNGVPVVSVYDYLDDKSKLDTPNNILEKGDKNAIYEYEFNRKFMEKRMVVMEFLEEMFQYNPDEHVRSAYIPNEKDNTRKPIDTMAARIARKNLYNKDPEYKLKNPSDKPKTKKIKRVMKNSKTGAIKTEIVEVPVPDDPSKKMESIYPEPLDEESPKDPNVLDVVYNIIPPHDLFGHFKRYYTENFEELREATTNLYCEKPDLELAINPYSWHSSLEEAEAFKKQHAEEVIAEVFTAHSGKWNFFDTWKEQRESVNFYNKNTIILEEIVNQIKRDEMLGQDLMKKRVEKEKKKNVLETGPDAESFKKWRSENKDLEKLGAKYIGDMAEDVPDNAIEVPIWRVAKGGLEVTRDKIYSLAEAPTFVNDKPPAQ